MRRQIIFRGKNLYNGEWVYGDLVHISGGTIIITSQEEGPVLPDNCDHALEYRIDEFAPVDPETIGQWTGLTDADGQRIFEGDIIECIRSDGAPIRHYIKYHNRECSYIQYIIEEGVPHGFNDGGAYMAILHRPI